MERYLCACARLVAQWHQTFVPLEAVPFSQFQREQPTDRVSDKTKHRKTNKQTNKQTQYTAENPSCHARKTDEAGEGVKGQRKSKGETDKRLRQSLLTDRSVAVSWWRPAPTAGFLFLLFFYSFVKRFCPTVTQTSRGRVHLKERGGKTVVSSDSLT